MTRDGRKLLEAISEFVTNTDGDERFEAIDLIRNHLHSLCPNSDHPVDRVRWVPVEDVQANDYNPNSVANKELKLLYTSIKHDGYTQPVVTSYDKKTKRYVIVDGFHRYFVSKSNGDILEGTNGMLPVVVIRKDVNDRMASTIRHNRARGVHSVDGMTNMVFRLLNNGWGDAEICNELGMEAEELLRLKHITGFSKLLEKHDYRKAWATKTQVRIAAKEGEEVL